MMHLKSTHYLILIVFLLSFLSCQNQTSSSTLTADVIIYGGTSAAVIAAVQVAKMGKSVIMLSPDKHLGGLTAGGLGWTDSGRKEVIGGLSRAFYHRIYLKYQQAGNWPWQKMDEYGNKGQGAPAIDGDERSMWIFEPHIAEQVFEDFIKEYQIKLYVNYFKNLTPSPTSKRIPTITAPLARTTLAKTTIIQRLPTKGDRKSSQNTSIIKKDSCIFSPMTLPSPKTCKRSSMNGDLPKMNL